MQAAEIKRPGIMLEAHGNGVHVCRFREIVAFARQQTLAAPIPLAPGDARYAAMLRHLRATA